MAGVDSGGDPIGTWSAAGPVVARGTGYNGDYVVRTSVVG